MVVELRMGDVFGESVFRHPKFRSRLASVLFLSFSLSLFLSFSSLLSSSLLSCSLLSLFSLFSLSFSFSLSFLTPFNFHRLSPRQHVLCWFCLLLLWIGFLSLVMLSKKVFFSHSLFSPLLFSSPLPLLLLPSSPLFTSSPLPLFPSSPLLLSPSPSPSPLLLLFVISLFFSFQIWILQQDPFLPIAHLYKLSCQIPSFFRV